MNPIIGYVGFGIVLVALFIFRMKWAKDIPDLSHKKVLEAVTSRIVLDIVCVTLVAWPIFRFHFDLDFLTLHRILWSFLLVLSVLFFTLQAIIRWKYASSKVG